MTVRQPAVFIGHGSPMNALELNKHTQALRDFGAARPRPSAIISISAHWYTQGTHVTAMPSPRTIHDFRGFPDALFAVNYPAPGDPELAQEVAELLAPTPVGLDLEWGLDHGTWQVLLHMYPDADIPVIQLSIDASAEPQKHYDMGRALGNLRDRGVMILGSGNVVHNLRVIDWSKPDDGHDWANRYNDLVRERILKQEHNALIGFKGDGSDANLSIPTDEHYLPLLYVAGASAPTETLEILTDGTEYGSLSMLSVAVG